MGIPSPTFSYRLGEAGRSEWVPYTSVTVAAPPGKWPDYMGLAVGLRTRWWLSGSSSVHVVASASAPVLAPRFSPEGIPVRRWWAPSVGAGYSVTLGEVVTLGIGLEATTSFAEPTVRLPDGSIVEVVDEPYVGMRIGGASGSSLPLLSVHLNEVWSLTGNAFLAFTLRSRGSQSMSTHLSAGVLATF
ncbi:hypothetical protein ACN28I_43415 [Archangium gephyra]|uniref:hypothetical protein n=1 Tax=Archangium gephyra TaxID=48 RepID=UPI003B7C2C5B